MDETPQDMQLNSFSSEISDKQRVKMEIVDLLHANIPLSLINWTNIQPITPNGVRSPAKYLDRALRELDQDGVIAHRPHDYSLSSYFLPPKEPEQDSKQHQHQQPLKTLILELLRTKPGQNVEELAESVHPGYSQQDVSEILYRLFLEGEVCVYKAEEAGELTCFYLHEEQSQVAMRSKQEASAFLADTILVSDFVYKHPGTALWEIDKAIGAEKTSRSSALTIIEHLCKEGSIIAVSPTGKDNRYYPQGHSMAIPEAEKKGKGVNPKDMVGATKIPLGLVPPIAIAYEAMTFQEGAAKYGPFNWRRTAAPVQMMTYLEAALGHILSLIDGQDIDLSSGSHHAAHARACLAIILDATACGNMIDNRPSTWPNRAKGVFSRDPASLLGDQEKVKALLSRKWYTYPDEGEPE
jgi:Domain of unknown function (DUF5664)